MEKFKRHGDGESSEWPERKKRKQKKSSVIKIAKIKGEEHVNHVGKLVNKRQTGKDCRKIITSSLPTIPANPLGKVPIKQDKMHHIKKGAEFVPQEDKSFYDSILLWPTTGSNDDDEL
ncbi:hypothetical protein FQA39_LY05933 [Lamprigera yunnana]|nr:hypothetical protein FQA39_LY05933 [Lamprigera yunnana]